MERERKGKNIVIGALLITVVSLSIAFAATLSSSLNINGTANIGEAKWDVYFASATPTANSTINPAPTFNVSKSTITYNVTLKEGDTLEFDALVKNDGTYNAKLNKLTIAGAEDYDGLITYETSGMTQGTTVINKNDSANLTVKVSMGTINGTNIGLLENGATLTLTVVAEFVQAE